MFGSKSQRMDGYYWQVYFMYFCRKNPDFLEKKTEELVARDCSWKQETWFKEDIIGLTR